MIINSLAKLGQICYIGSRLAELLRRGRRLLPKGRSIMARGGFPSTGNPNPPAASPGAGFWGDPTAPSPWVTEAEIVAEPVRWREPLAVTRIVADYQRGSVAHHLEIRLIQEATGVNGSSRVRKEALLDGVKRPIHEIIGHFNAVIFVAQMTQIFGPSRYNHRNLSFQCAWLSYSFPLAKQNKPYASSMSPATFRVTPVFSAM